MMNTSPQITSVEETIRIPAWRNASPKNRNTRSRNTSPTIREVNLTISPNDSTHPRGVASAPITRSLHDRRDLRVRGQQHLGEHIVERKDPQERDHHRLVDGPPHPLGPTRGGHPLVTTDHRDDRPEQGRLHHRS